LILPFAAGALAGSALMTLNSNPRYLQQLQGKYPLCTRS
jgi:hypothetical protein